MPVLSSGDVCLVILRKLVYTLGFSGCKYTTNKRNVLSCFVLFNILYVQKTRRPTPRKDNPI